MKVNIKNRIMHLLIAIMIVMSNFAYMSCKNCVIFPSGKRITVEIADTDKKREKGLMFRKSLDYNEGMLFIFEEEDFHTFWMKNTYIYLDLIWLDGSKKIVYYVENADPCKGEPCEHYTPLQKAKYVLELNGGFIKKEKLKLGEKISFDW